MPYVKQIALVLNIAVPAYYVYYHFFVEPMYSAGQNKQNSSQDKKAETFLNFLLTVIVLLSPVLHILTWSHPPYCYKGHCRPPHHCRRSDNLMFQEKDQTYEKAKKDVIKQSVRSSRNEPIKGVSDENKSYNDQTQRQRKNFFNLQKVQSPPSKMKMGCIEETYNSKQTVNQFSNFPMLGRSSRKSISNSGNNESPRISRNSKNGNLEEAFLEQNKMQPLKVEEDIYNHSQYSYSPNVNGSPYVGYSGDKTSGYDNFYQELTVECQFCEQCHIPKYLRMKHCYRCGKCVHKYDHHCVLLNICIGQTNHKYYIGFLYAHLYNTVLVLKELLGDLKDHVELDLGTGIQHIGWGYCWRALSIIVLSLNLILTVYLTRLHTEFLFTDSTTYERQRRATINYFRHLNKHSAKYQILTGRSRSELQIYNPFDQGYTKNCLKTINIPKEPNDWKLPSETDFMIEMKERKPKVKIASPKAVSKFEGGCEWGQQSNSSNNFQTGKTTKSRQSMTRRSKNIEEKPMPKSPFKE